MNAGFQEVRWKRARVILTLLAAAALAAPAWAIGTTASKTTLTASPAPATLQHAVTLTATVAPASGAGATPTGTVSFADGATPIPTSTCPGTLSAGVATCTVTFTTTGAHTLAAKYAGDATYAVSSTTFSESVTLVPTTTALTSSANPATQGSSVTFTATVAGTNPSGNVTFYSYGTSIGTAALSAGVATLPVTYASPGSRPVYAAYAGDAVNAASQSATLTQAVKSTATVALAASPNPATQGASVTLTATIAGFSPTGTVTFNDSTPGATANWGPVTIASGKATTTASFSMAGTHTLTAIYSGDGNNFGANSLTTSEVITATSAAATTTTLTASTPTPPIGSPTTLTATVAGGSTPTGTVTFKDGSTTIACAGTLASGTTVCVWTPTSLGSHSLTAGYSGDASHATSTAILTTTVGKTTPTLTLAPSANPSKAGATLTLTATIAGYLPTGTVQFKDGATNLGSAVTMAAGQATTSVTPGAAGGHAYQAVYSGDVDNNTATATTSVNVIGRTTTTAITTSTTSATPTTSVTFTATITGASPTGTVTFRDGAATLGTATLAGGTASLSKTLALGLHAIAAGYAGDATNAPSLSTTTLVQVTAAGTTPPAGAAMQLNYQYDAQGNLTQIVDANAATTQQAYDSLSRTTQIKQPIPATGASAPIIGLSYDLQDQPSKVTDPRSLSTTYTTDGLGNTTQLQSPDTGTTTNTYYDNGLLKTTQDARGRIATYGYDAGNRVKTIAYDAGTGTSFTYDETAGGNLGKEHLTTVTDESGTTHWVYDGFGRVVTKTQTTGPSSKSFTVTYAYGTSGSANGKLQAITYPSGAKVSYGYDNAGRVNSVRVTGADGITTPILSGLAYTGLNQPLSWVWGTTGTVYQRGYDGYGRLATYPLGNPAGTGIAAGVTRTIEYDAAGRIVGYSHTTPANWDQVFNVDGLGRLTGSTTTGGISYTYTYDANGNRTGWTLNGTAYTDTVSATSNRYTNVTTPAGGATAQGYDAKGDLTSDAAGTYTYSSRGRMSAAARSGNSFGYLYNALEQRVYKSGPTSVIATGALYYVYDEAGRVIGEYDATGKANFETVYLGDMPVAALTQASIGHTTVSYVYADHLNTARVIVRPSDQAILWVWSSQEAFGQTLATNPNSSTLGSYTYNLRFPGQIADAESNWFENWTRSYDPNGGVYKQSDMLGLAGASVSTYGYVSGSPLSRFDSQGLLGSDIAVDDAYLAANMGHSVGEAALAGVAMLSVSTLGMADLMGLGPLAALLLEANNLADGMPASSSLPMGSRRLQLNQPKNMACQPIRNQAMSVGNLSYSGHALDRMQDRGLPPSVIQNTIDNGIATPSRGGTTVYYDATNNVSVVTNSQGAVVTVKYGR
jgi:RHS repeat-associated protein